MTINSSFKDPPSLGHRKSNREHRQQPWKAHGRAVIDLAEPGKLNSKLAAGDA